MPRRITLSVLGIALALLVVNWAPLLDAMAYRPLVAQARALLPEDWRGLRGNGIALDIASLEAAQSPRQRDAMRAASAVFLDTPEGVVLAIPRGFETEVLNLDTGCFRFVRRRASIIVWHFNLPLACL